MTPPYDAIGRGIGILDEASGDAAQVKCVLIVMTDGLENASREFTLDAIQGVIEASQEAGWKVVFLGQGLDVAAQGYALGIAGANNNVVAFQRSAGLRKALSGLPQRIIAQYVSSQVEDEECDQLAGEEAKKSKA